MGGEWGSWRHRPTGGWLCTDPVSEHRRNRQLLGKSRAGAGGGTDPARAAGLAAHLAHLVRRLGLDDAAEELEAELLELERGQVAGHWGDRAARGRCARERGLGCDLGESARAPRGPGLKLWPGHRGTGTPSQTGTVSASEHVPPRSLRISAGQCWETHGLRPLGRPAGRRGLQRGRGRAPLGVSRRGSPRKRL